MRHKINTGVIARFISVLHMLLKMLLTCNKYQK
uniref:Uncharacterized protein n=1 Tax=Anguilla anguilla TaxID=7936 RepID=A0A0E9W848_ANGAN